jgi:WD40 repeat protein
MFQVSNGACLSLIQLPNGQLAAGSGFNITIWDPLSSVAAPLTTLTGHTDKVLVLALSPNGSLLASGSADTSVKLWSYSSQTSPLKTFIGHTGKVRALCFVSNQILASGSYDLSIKIWDISSGNLKANIFICIKKFI